MKERVAAAEAEIARRTRQQAALAELGQAALSRVDVGLLVGQTCALVEWALAASYVSIVQAAGNELALRFGVGSNPSFSQCNDAAAEHTPLLLCTLTLNEPMTFRSRVADPRVNRDHLFEMHQVESGACLPIPGRDRAFGLLTAYTDDDRAFAPDELEFLRAIANITGAIILSTESDDARRRAETARAETEDRYRALVENASEGVALVDAHGVFLYTGPSTSRVLGYGDGELLAQNFADLVHPADLDLARKNLRVLLTADNAELAGEVRLKHASGEYRWIEGTYKNLLFNPAVGAIVINYRDVTERKLAEETLQHLAYRDTLTDLPNRFLFQDRLDHALEQARRRGSGVAVMYIDLDRFKIVNDTLGHTVGDRLLQVVA
ncbi:MAG TPA: diguanylate cyclase, partial [Thermoanaerobaculia bacterium]